MGALIVFGLVLAVMGGGIAYAGDRLGSYIGKKRHSSFGLRPRHTAMLWTVVSGGGVAVLTLLLFLALNHAFSAAIVRGPQLLSANARLAEQNKALARQSRANETRAAADSERAAQAQSDANAAQQKAAEAQAQAAKGQADLAAVAGKLGQARQGLQQARLVLTNRQKALADAQAHLAEAKRGLGTTRSELARAETRVRQAKTGVTQAKRQVQLANSQLAGASRSVLQLGIRQDELARENLRLARQNSVQRDALAATQGRPLVLRREEELGRVVVKADQPLDTLRHTLAVFLDRVELTARKHGAGGTDNSPAILVPAPGESSQKPSGTDKPGTDKPGVDKIGTDKPAREAALEALSQSITAQGETLPSIVVVASARYNTFKSEPVHVDLRPYANLLVFPKGQIIARGTLDGTGSEDAVLRGLQLFLTGPVRAAALQGGIIPLRDPQSGEPQVGEPIGSADSLELVHEVREAGAGAHLTASVAEDTYSADLLHLTLRVTPAPRPAPRPEPRPVGGAGE